MSFEQASAVRRVGQTTWAGEVVPGWDIMGNADGGYTLAIAARAAAEAAERPDPVTVTAHYLAPARPGPVSIEARVVRRGNRFATVAATLVSAERPLLALLGTFAELGGYDGPERVDAAPPPLPMPEECVLVVPTETFPPPFMGRVELRLDPADDVFGGMAGPPRVSGWFRFPAGEAVDTLGLLVAVDAFPPTVLRSGLPFGWVPTVELTAHVRARPEPGWLRCAFTTRFITGGFLEEDGEVWDGSGRLVAQSRQLALLPRG
ncbi:MAG TPA: thioesterase family protein [Acidimicrobiia bacterium]|nr:thioesterase family protein [Acidimicrobiia bacterium]